MQAAGAIPAVFFSMFPKHGAWHGRCLLRARKPLSCVCSLLAGSGRQVCQDRSVLACSQPTLSGSSQHIVWESLHVGVTRR